MLVSCGGKDNSLSSESVDIQANISSDGTVEVKEYYMYKSIDKPNRITRSINSKITDFKAYIAQSDQHTSIDTQQLQALKINQVNNKYHINLPALNDGDQLVYSYAIQGAVTKYKDVADLDYSFFNENDHSDLNNVTIRLNTPSNQDRGDAIVFFHSKNQPTIQTTDNMTYYSYDSLDASSAVDLRLIFPANQLTEHPVDQNKEMKNRLLISETSLHWRYKNIESNFNSKIPLISLGITLTLLIGTCLLYFHPNRKQDINEEKSILHRLENTDPLMVSYVKNQTHLDVKAIIAGLFNLHQRDLISITEVDSEINEGHTFRLTWNRSYEKLKESDIFLKEWLFKKQDAQGCYFLLESINNSNENKQMFNKWRHLVIDHDSFKEVRNNYIPYQLFSFSVVLVTLGFLTYFLLNEVWTREIQYTIILIFTILGSFVLIFNCHKVLMTILLSLIFLQSFFLTITTATLLFMTFIIIVGCFSCLIPNYYWRNDINELRWVIKRAETLLKNKQYPIGNTPKHVEKQLQYAIILEQAEKFTQACKPIPATLLASGNYPMLHKLKQTATAFDPRHR